MDPVPPRLPWCRRRLALTRGVPNYGTPPDDPLALLGLLDPGDDRLFFFSDDRKDDKQHLLDV